MFLKCDWESRSKVSTALLSTSTASSNLPRRNFDPPFIYRHSHFLDPIFRSSVKRVWFSSYHSIEIRCLTYHILQSVINSFQCFTKFSLYSVNLLQQQKNNTFLIPCIRIFLEQASILLLYQSNQWNLLKCPFRVRAIPLQQELRIVILDLHFIIVTIRCIIIQFYISRKIGHKISPRLSLGWSQQFCHSFTKHLHNHSFSAPRIRFIFKNSTASSEYSTSK